MLVFTSAMLRVWLGKQSLRPDWKSKVVVVVADVFVVVVVVVVVLW